ncbi:Pol polyprotein, partial [Mucuna pruriens]
MRFGQEAYLVSKGVMGIGTRGWKSVWDAFESLAQQFSSKIVEGPIFLNSLIRALRPRVFEHGDVASFLLRWLVPSVLGWASTFGLVQAIKAAGINPVMWSMGPSSFLHRLDPTMLSLSQLRVAWDVGSDRPAPRILLSTGFILVAIDYFTKWVEAASYASVTKSVVVKFIKRDIICRYRLPTHIITNNATNLNNKMMIELCKQFKIKHHHSTPYCPKMNEAVEATNKNIKKIVQKMVVTSKDWHDMLPYTLHGY